MKVMLSLSGSVVSTSAKESTGYKVVKKKGQKSGVAYVLQEHKHIFENFESTITAGCDLGREACAVFKKHAKLEESIEKTTDKAALKTKRAEAKALAKEGAELLKRGKKMFSSAYDAMKKAGFSRWHSEFDTDCLRRAEDRPDFVLREIRDALKGLKNWTIVGSERGPRVIGSADDVYRPKFVTASAFAKLEGVENYFDSKGAKDAAKRSRAASKGLPVKRKYTGKPKERMPKD